GKNPGQTKFFQQRRVKKIRDRTDLGQGLIDEFRAFLDVGSGTRMDGAEMLLSEGKVQLGHGKQLAGAIVQVAAEFTAFFIPQIQKMAGDNSQLLLGTP